MSNEYYCQKLYQQLCIQQQMSEQRITHQSSIFSTSKLIFSALRKRNHHSTTHIDITQTLDTIKQQQNVFNFVGKGQKRYATLEQGQGGQMVVERRRVSCLRSFQKRSESDNRLAVNNEILHVLGNDNKIQKGYNSRLIKCKRSMHDFQNKVNQSQIKMRINSKYYCAESSKKENIIYPVEEKKTSSLQKLHQVEKQCQLSQKFVNLHFRCMESSDQEKQSNANFSNSIKHRQFMNQRMKHIQNKTLSPKGSAKLLTIGPNRSSKIFQSRSFNRNVMRLNRIRQFKSTNLQQNKPQNFRYNKENIKDKQDENSQLDINSAMITNKNANNSKQEYVKHREMAKVERDAMEKEKKEEMQEGQSMLKRVLKKMEVNRADKIKKMRKQAMGEKQEEMLAKEREAYRWKLFLSQPLQPWTIEADNHNK